MMGKVRVLFERSAVGQYLTKLKRERRSDKKFFKQNKKSTSTLQSLRIITHIFSRNVLLLFIGFVILAIVFVHFAQYFSLNPTAEGQFSNEKNNETKIFDPQQTHTAVYVISQNESGYIFVDYIAIVSQGDTIKFIQVSPLFTSRIHSDTTLRTLLNNVTSFEENYEMHIEILNDAVSALLGIKIDRFIYFDTHEFSDYLQSRDILPIDDVQTLFDTTTIATSEYVQNQLEITSDIFRNKFSLIHKYKLFWDFDEISEVIITDYSRKSFFDFLNSFSTGKRVQALAINIDQGFIDHEGLEKTLALQPNSILIDESLAGFISNIDILAEQAELEIYNASSKGGLASRYTRELQNIGINIVKYGNYFEEIDQTTLYLREEQDLKRYTNTIKAIQQSLNGSVTLVIGEYNYNQTGDLILVLFE